MFNAAKWQLKCQFSNMINRIFHSCSHFMEFILLQKNDKMLSKAWHLFSSTYLTHCILGNFACFLSSADFFSKITF